MISIKLHSEVYYFSYKKLDSKCSSETLVSIKQTYRPRHREEHNKNFCRRMNVKL